jgi:hypothetical protein
VYRQRSSRSTQTRLDRRSLEDCHSRSLLKLADPDRLVVYPGVR